MDPTGPAVARRAEARGIHRPRATEAHLSGASSEDVACAGPYEVRRYDVYSA